MSVSTSRITEVLEIKQLSFRYQYKVILSKLSFAVNPGEILHITGPNGSGKTTLMSILAGLRKESAGKITFRLSDGTITDDRRTHVEYLPAEANALYGKMDAMSNLRFWRKLRGLDASDQYLRPVLARWDLDHPLIRENFPVESFSTGMKRRLALARLELSETECWLLDEPLYGLDTKGIETFQDMLEKHHLQNGITVIVSHDIAPLEKFPVRRLDLTPTPALTPGVKGA
ncbi:MAG: heme ABC exporter ATP-binding protein CcmA [Proteobacteria bacterium]|nr:MAG: heme ABC exporter ATP-binding protein CcmA [Pseudomonadota bacterium]